MLCFIIFHWPVTKIFIAGRKCCSFNTQVSVFIDVWRLHAAIPCACVWSHNFNLQPVGIGRVQNDLQACIQSFLKAFSLFLVFSVPTKPNKTLHFNASPGSHSKQKKKTFQRWNMPSFFKLVSSSFFLFAVLWSNSTHLDESHIFQSMLTCQMQ